jgi:hypothetical protein
VEAGLAWGWWGVLECEGGGCCVDVGEGFGELLAGYGDGAVGVGVEVEFGEDRFCD